MRFSAFQYATHASVKLWNVSR